MEYFKKYFSEVENWNAEEVKVLCPYHQDTNPSASINTEKGLFHCWVCDIGFNEAQFMAKVNNISTTEAIKLIDNYSASDDWQVAVAKMWSDIPFKNKVNELGLSDDTIHKFKLGLVIDPVSNRKTLGIPIFYNNLLVDVRRYNLLGYANVPKVVSEKDRVGWVVPYDLLIDSNEPCYLFEGEKDMLYARELGINAFTLTGGANSVPNEYSIGSFENKDIIVCYDNDKAGQDGMLKIFKALKDVAKRIRYIDISKSVNKVGEDFYDFITKYKNDIFDFYALEIQEFDVSKLEKDILTTIKKALNKNILKKDIKSVVTITAEYADPYSVPTIVHLEKVAEEGKKDTLFQGEERKWYLEKNNNYQLLELIEANAKDEEVRAKLKMFMGIPAKEGGIEIKQRELRTVYKCTIADKDVDGSGVSLDLYSFDKLNVGGQYIIEYSIYPHPTKHQKLVAVCSKSKLVHDENNYILDKGLLDNFKIKGTIEERLETLYQSAKHYVAKHLDFNIWLMTDLVFNSILDFNYGETMRGALDIFLLGDTQVGKALPLEELVLTPEGYKPMKDIVLGSTVYTQKGTKTKVIGVYPQGKRPVYKITLSDGSSVEADGEHLWKVQNFNQRHRSKKYSIITTKDLIKGLHTFKDKRNNYSIDFVDPIQFDKKELKIDPYVMGVLISDGCLGQKTVKLTNAEYDIIEKVRAKIETISKLSNYGGGEYGLNNDVKRIIESYKLNVNSIYKHIPEEYLMSDVSDRLEMLRGLIDTDGSVSANNISYSTSSEQLRDDVIFLIQSLGGRVVYRVKHPKLGKVAYELYIHFSNGIIPFSSKKHTAKFSFSSKKLKRYIESIEYVGEKECQCIIVDDEEHLFVTKDMIVTHNSETTSKLTELYNFGHFLSLKTSTTTGLIGGSSKVEGTYYNTIGAIPRQHKRLVVLEEFSGARPDFIKTMTDIRSSNEIRLTRVAGELRIPCKLRMITISNPINDDNGNPRFLNTFPNGVMPIMELIKSAEDVARYDGFLLIPKIEKRFNPFGYKLQGDPIPKEAYEHKINWVYTRLPDNVRFEEGVEGYIWEKAQELNEIFECNFPMFGVTTSKKLARFAVALASLLFNVDDSYENIIVTKEIVDYMVEKQKELYSLPIFRLNDYAREYKEYSEYTEGDVKELESLYAKNATLFDFLHSNSKTSRFNLSSVSGLKTDDFNPIFNKLVADKYIRLNMDSIYPTDKFRKVYKIINKKYKINQGTLIDTQGVTFINDLERKEQ